MTQRKTMAERNVLTVWPKSAEKLKALAAVDALNWGDLANEIIATFLSEHRSNKPLVLPEERFSERNQDDVVEMICW